MKQKDISALSVAGVYIGTVVGAGFATGQEILQFFVHFGARGLLGLILAACLFVFFGLRILRLGRNLRACSHREIIIHASGPRLGVLLDAIITFFLFGSVASMIAGTGALFKQLWNLPESAGGLLMAIFTAAAVWRGISGVISSIRFVALFLIVSVAAVSIYTLRQHPPAFAPGSPGRGCKSLMSHFLLAALLYVSYNTVLSVAVLGPWALPQEGARSVPVRF
jgi:uncharacterized membrane protein YkvI